MIEGIIVILIVLIALIFLGLFMQWISHISGYRIKTRYGVTISDPRDWKNTTEVFNSINRNKKASSRKSIVIEKDPSLNILYDKIARFNNSYSTRLQDKNEFTNDRLFIVEILMKKGIITEEESDILKVEMLKSEKYYKWESCTDENGLGRI